MAKVYQNIYIGEAGELEVVVTSRYGAVNLEVNAATGEVRACRVVQPHNDREPFGHTNLRERRS